MCKATPIDGIGKEKCQFLTEIVLDIRFSIYFFLILDMGLKLKIVPDSWEYTGFWKFGPYWPQK